VPPADPPGADRPDAEVELAERFEQALGDGAAREPVVKTSGR
jgi:hypothetical protein